MKLTQRYISSLFALALVCTACGHKAGKSSDSDSVADAKEQQEKDLAPFPDTTFASVEQLNYKVEILDSTAQKPISPLHDLYADAPGIMTFRGNAHRDASFTGSVDKRPSRVDVVWRFETSSDAKWGGGSGWTGQPVYVTWPDSLVKKFRAANVVNADFSGNEVIVGSLDGKVYFLNPENGKTTREPVDMGNPIKGSVSLDPTMNGYLYVGQGIPNVQPFGAMTIDLKSNEVISKFGVDSKAQRAWGAYDSSAVRAGQYVFRPGENGILYKWLPTPTGMTLAACLRFTRNGSAPGIESSMSVCRNYGYFNDNAGNVLCVNLDTMKPVWYYDNHDDSDSSPIVIEENGHPYVYTGTEIDRQGQGQAYYVKLDGLTGEKIWEHQVPGRQATVGEKHFDGGFYATPLPGRADCQGMLFANVVTNTQGQNGHLEAIDIKTGKTLYKTDLKHYPWSSPVALTGKDGKMYIFTGDTAGNVYVIEGKTGEILVTKSVGNNFESSPVVVGNEIYLGTRGNTIFKMKIS